MTRRVEEVPACLLTEEDELCVDLDADKAELDRPRELTPPTVITLEIPVIVPREPGKWVRREASNYRH